MPNIGTKTVTLHTVDRDETVYAGATHTVSHKDVVSLRRTMPANGSKPLRTNVRYEAGFSVPEGGEKSVTVSIAVTVPPGVSTEQAQAYIQDALTQSATVAAGLAITGDIHL